MLVIERITPKRRELVVCRIKKINPHSAVVELLEYGGVAGLVHVSEVASRWVRDIREFLKEGQYVVCRVMRISGSDISLSIKRVHRDESNRKLGEFKRENRAWKLLEIAGKAIGKDPSRVKKEMHRLIIEEFGSVTKMFEFALKDRGLLMDKIGSREWVDAIVDIAGKNYAEKIYQVKADLNLVSYSSHGVEDIKESLQPLEKKGFVVSYISAPKYQISKQGKDFKKTRKEVESAARKVVDSISGKGEACFEIQ